METQYTRLSMTPSGVPPVIYMSQNDIGRPIGFVCDADLSNYAVVLEATRTDGTPITVAATVDGNICAFETTATMTNKADVYIAQIVVTNASGKHISSIPIKCVVILAAMNENSEGIEEDAPLYQQYTGTVQSLIADIRTQLNAEASARQAADNQLQSNINAEASTRATTDASLQSQINQLIAPSGSAPSAAEVTNARIGADGTTYDTLGNAIRGQVTDVKSALEDITVESKNLYNKTTNLKNKIMGSTGSIIDYSGYQVSDKIPVIVGEKYFISVYPTNVVGPRRVGLFGANDALVRMIDQSYSSQVITIDSGVSYLRITGSDNTMLNNKIQVEHNDHQTYYVNEYREPEYRDSVIQITDDLYCGDIDFLEQGTFSSGVPSASTTRVRMSRTLDWRFTIKVNPGYRIRQIERFDHETGAFVEEVILTSVVTEYTSNGKYSEKLVFCKTDTNATVAYTEDIILSVNSNVSLFRDMYDAVLSDVFSDIELEQGTINASGENSSSNNRVRFKNSIKNAFHIKTNSNYVVRFIVLYDKDTGTHISTTTVRDTEFTSLGEYAVRLVFAYADLETLITPNDDIIDVVDGTLATTMGIASAGYAELCTLTTLPNPQKRQFARVNLPYGLLWSDNYCWRMAKDNTLAVSSNSYKTIKVSDGSEINSNNKTQVNQCYSMTKVMTAVLLEENVNDLTQTITVNSTDVGSQTPIATEMHEGDTASYEVMLNCSLIYSDNIATDCIGRNIGYVLNPSAANDAEALASFFDAMSAKATALGMTNTGHFVSPHGQMTSTPDDMCKLFKYAQDNCPVIKSIWGKLNYTVVVTGTNPRSWEITSTTDAVDREILPEFIGGKTGSSDTLGTYGFVWKSVTDDQLYITVLMDSPIANRERFYNARQILNDAYSMGA